jgi:hypothetical protein
VLGSDRGKIGTVEEVGEPVAGDPAYMLVRHNLILDHDTYIPLRVPAGARREGQGTLPESHRARCRSRSRRRCRR